jgi:preprotein translocase subunit Sec61beta
LKLRISLRYLDVCSFYVKSWEKRHRKPQILPGHALLERDYMAQEKKGEGFHSGAGLIRYFDAEEKTAVKIPPWFVVFACIATAVVVIAIELWKPL